MYPRKRSLTKKEILRKRYEIRNVFNNTKKNAKKENTVNYTLIYKENEFTWNRVLVIVDKKIKSAVLRNKEKRVVKEIYRQIKEKLKVGFDIIILTRTSKKKFTERLNEIVGLFVKADLMYT
ncbi:MAG: ribonuclease P protein component [Spirochaetales bacterium]|nr:ribonuclease P protein component [Spirochaetales bacterium]